MEDGEMALLKGSETFIQPRSYKHVHRTTCACISREHGDDEALRLDEESLRMDYGDGETVYRDEETLEMMRLGIQMMRLGIHWVNR